MRGEIQSYDDVDLYNMDRIAALEHEKAMNLREKPTYQKYFLVGPLQL